MVSFFFMNEHAVFIVFIFVFCLSHSDRIQSQVKRAKELRGNGRNRESERKREIERQPYGRIRFYN